MQVIFNYYKDFYNKISRQDNYNKISKRQNDKKDQ